MSEQRLIDLASELVRAAVLLGWCPFCGAGPFDRVASHFRVHGYTVNEVRRHAGLNRTHGLTSAEARERARLATLRQWHMGLLTKPTSGRNTHKRWVARPETLERFAIEREPLPGVEHGSASAYKAGCRCGKCRRGNTERIYEYRRRKREGLPPPPKPERPHGRISRYQDGCRCDDCKRISREKRAAHRRSQSEDTVRDG